MIDCRRSALSALVLLYLHLAQHYLFVIPGIGDRSGRVPPSTGIDRRMLRRAVIRAVHA